MIDHTDIYGDGPVTYGAGEAFPKPRRRLWRTLLRRSRPVRHFATRRNFIPQPNEQDLEYAAQWGEHILLEDYLIVLHRDATMTAVRHFVTQLHSRESLEAWDEVYRPYDARSQSLKLLQAKLYWTDGTSRQANITTHRIGIPQGAPNTHGRMHQIVFSPLRPGMIVELEEQFDDFKPGPNWPAIWGHYYLQTAQPCRYRRQTVAIAEPYELSYRMHFGAAPPREDRYKDYHIYTWEVSDVPGVEFDEWTPPLRDFAPWVDMSTATTWAPFAEKFKTELVPLFNSSREMNDLVRELSHEKKDPLEKATAAYTYAARTVRYGRPRSEMEIRDARRSNQIFQDLQGDCKDKSALLVQLLRAMGMSANVAVVLTGDEGRSPFLPSSRFNHAIVRAEIDGRTYWLDAASGEFAFGELPPIDQNIHALVLGDQAFHFERVPGRLASEHVEYRDNKGSLKLDGSFEGDYRIEYAGELGARLRAQFVDRTAEHRTKVLQAWLGSDYPGAIGSNFVYETVDRLSGRAAYQCHVKIPQVARQIKNILLLQIPWAGKLSMVGPMASEQRMQPLALPPSYLSFERQIVDLPQKVVPFAIPEFVSLKSHWGEYRCNWQAVDNQLVCERVIQYGGPPIPSSQFAEFKDFWRQGSVADTTPIVLRIED